MVGLLNAGSLTANYWLDGTGPTYGNGGAGNDTEAAKFNGAGNWPLTSTHDAWDKDDDSMLDGIKGGSPAYWQSLGSFGGEYPKLWWE